jgi:hypothetical protein
MQNPLSGRHHKQPGTGRNQNQKVLTMGGGRQIGNPSSPATAGSNALEYTKYLVGPTGRYATIQAAIDAAVADGFTGVDAATQAVIWIQAGSYSENVTVPGGYFTLCGLGGIDVTLGGSLTWTLAGAGTGTIASLENLQITGTTTFAAPAANADIIIADCRLPALTINCTGTASVANSTINGVLTHTASARCTVTNCVIGDNVTVAGNGIRFASCTATNSSLLISGTSVDLYACSFIISRINMTGVCRIHGSLVICDAPGVYAITGSTITTSGSYLGSSNGLGVTNSQINGSFVKAGTTPGFGPNSIALLSTFAKGYVERVATTSFNVIDDRYNVGLDNAHKYIVQLSQPAKPINISGIEAGAQYVLQLQQDGVGGRTVTWPASVRWAGGLPPVLSVAANAIDVVTMVSLNGTTLLAVPNLNFL